MLNDFKTTITSTLQLFYNHRMILVLQTQGSQLSKQRERKKEFSGYFTKFPALTAVCKLFGTSTDYFL